MALRQVTAPASEPVTLDEAKLQIRQDDSADDAFIQLLISEARRTVEDMARRALMTQTWRLSLDGWPRKDYISLPRPPLQSVTGVVYKDSAGGATTWDTANYIVDTEHEPGRIYLAYGASWPSVTLYPANPIQITYKAGYGDAAGSVPETWRRAILLLIGHWYENRENVVTGGAIPKEIPLGVKNLVWLNRG